MYHTPPLQAEKIDEFFGDVSESENSRIDKLIKAIQDDPSAQLFVIIGFQKKTLLKKQTKKEKEIFNLLVKENRISADQIVIKRKFSEKESVQFWLVPTGATPPEIKEQS